MDHLPFWEINTHASGTGFGQGVADIIEYIATLTPSAFSGPFAWMASSATHLCLVWPPGLSLLTHDRPTGLKDPDFLETLFPVTMNFVDSRTEYTFWSLWSAPLLISTDIRNMCTSRPLAKECVC